MSWFGFGGGKKDEDRAPEVPLRIDDFQDDTAFAAPSLDYGNGGGGGGGSFQQQLAMEQQKLMIQAIMMKLTDMSFERCVTKPSTSISYSEQNCINSTVGKFIDTSQLVMKRFQMAQGDGHN